MADETEVTEEAEEEPEEKEVEEAEKPEAVTSETVAELKGQVETLTKMLQQRETAPEKETPKPEPLIPDIDDLPEEEQKYAKMVNIMGDKLASMERKLEGKEEDAEDREFRREVGTFVDSHKDLKADTKLQKKFKDFINAALVKGDAKLFMEAAYNHLVSKKPGKKKPALNSQKPTTPAGKTTKNQGEPLGYEQAKARAREGQLKILQAK